MPMTTDEFLEWPRVNRPRIYDEIMIEKQRRIDLSLDIATSIGRQFTEAEDEAFLGAIEKPRQP